MTGRDGTDAAGRLAEALADPRVYSETVQRLGRELAAILLPVVREIADQRAAEETAFALRDAWRAIWGVLDRHEYGYSAMAQEAKETVHRRIQAFEDQAAALRGEAGR